ncbi:cyclin-like protein [Fimicolochytrium jonesii]|uniref:cyclin-like protein n=1 Tax=Fimicolochytrium jonesii TaxID=1396493 RepID=UPI0022FE7F9B|nr:cyclin-like protein [Fimicolochytrium jonesii]KAI8821529.1 cyclin-like protein [Fimicolochytrium jonesii]
MLATSSYRTAQSYDGPVATLPAHSLPARPRPPSPRLTPPTSVCKDKRRGSKGSMGRRSDLAEFSEYGAEIFALMLEAEVKTGADSSFMNLQKELSWPMRETLLTWLVQVHAEHNLQPDTLYLTINIIDRVCAQTVIKRDTYQLLGATALWIAAKYEENHGRVPNLKSLVLVCINRYAEADFLGFERHILRALRFDLGHPTPEAFLKAYFLRFIDDDDAESKEDAPGTPVHHVRAVARYLMELTTVLSPNGCMVDSTSSVLAMAAFRLGHEIYTYAGLKTSHLIKDSREAAENINDDNVDRACTIMEHCIAKGSDVLHQKYATSKHHCASHIVQAWWTRRKASATLHKLQISSRTPQRPISGNVMHPQSPYVTDMVDEGYYTPTSVYPAHPPPGLITPPKESLLGFEATMIKS